MTTEDYSSELIGFDMKQMSVLHQQSLGQKVARIGVTLALSVCVYGSVCESAFAQKDSRGWDGSTSSMYNNNSSSGSNSYGGSSFGSYGGPSHGAFTPFGRMSSGNPGYSNQSSDQSGPSAPAGNYYDSLPAARNTSVPFGNPNGKFTPPPNLSFQDQQIRNKQREQELQQSRASQPVNSSITQSQRWESEWRQQHPGEAMPSAGKLQQMHLSELQGNVNSGFAAMRQRAAAKSQEEYGLATKLSQRNAAAEGRTWSKAQFDREYDDSHKEHAQHYLDSVLQSREIQDRRAEMRRWDAIGGR